MTGFHLRKQILSALHQYGPMGRFDIHQRTGIRVTTVGTITSELIDEGVLREGNPQSAERPGRPKVMLEFDPVGACVAGINLELDAISACKMNLFGQVVSRFDEPVPDGSREELLPATLSKVVGKVKRLKPLGVGVSAPGLVDIPKRL
ncbi:MAG: hypothetical protein AAGH92_13000, partial [Planctomycetota bacterium]